VRENAPIERKVNARIRRVLVFMVDQAGPFLNTMFSIGKMTSHLKVTAEFMSTP
jgi:hypothetical protein